MYLTSESKYVINALTIMSAHQPPSDFPLTAPGRAPAAAGLYDPRHEHDACGVGFVVNIKGTARTR